MALTRQDVSQAVAELMPAIMRGIQLDFFVKKGVTQTQFLVLMTIHGDECCMGTLASNFGVSMPTVSGIVDRLVKAGYLRRHAAAGDRRKVMAELTPKGQSFIREFQQVMRRRWEDVLQTIEQDEMEAFHHVIVKLREQLSRSKSERTA